MRSLSAVNIPQLFAVAAGSAIIAVFVTLGVTGTSPSVTAESPVVVGQSANTVNPLDVIAGIPAQQQDLLTMTGQDVLAPMVALAQNGMATFVSLPTTVTSLPTVQTALSVSPQNVIDTAAALPQNVLTLTPQNVIGIATTLPQNVVESVPSPQNVVTLLTGLVPTIPGQP